MRMRPTMRGRSANRLINDALHGSSQCVSSEFAQLDAKVNIDLIAY